MDKVTIHKIVGKSESGLCYKTEDVVIEQAAGLSLVAPNGNEYILTSHEDGSISISACCYNHVTKSFIDSKSLSVIITDGNNVVMKPI